MTVKKKTKPRKLPKPGPRREKWRDALRRILSKVPEVDAIHVSAYGTYVHVYSVIEDFDDKVCSRLFKQEARFEKLFPRHYFEFHTRIHRGRKRNRSHGGIASKHDFGYRCSWHGRTCTATS